jgi:two-component sensor histidine kinase
MAIHETIVDHEFGAAMTDRRVWTTHAATQAELKAALAREEVLLRDRREMVRRQDLLTAEFGHRLVNSLQLIVSILSLQSRTASTPEAAAQLVLAANRVASIGRVHRRLHLLDHERSVEFKRYLSGLCDDLAGLLFRGEAGRAILVTGSEINLPSELAIPLGFIANELITNSAKYGSGEILVQIGSSAAAHVLSVADEGPGLPAGFEPSHSKGLGMTIVRSLLKQIGGTLRFDAGERNRGARFSVEFATPHVAG